MFLANADGLQLHVLVYNSIINILHGQRDTANSNAQCEALRQASLCEMLRTMCDSAISCCCALPPAVSRWLIEAVIFPKDVKGIEQIENLKASRHSFL